MRTYVLAALALLICASPAGAVTYSPPDQAGPDLSVPKDKLAASLSCRGNLDNATTTPVLLVPATGATPKQNYSWNYEVQFAKLGIPFCDVTLPEKSTADIQVAGEYVVNGIRAMHARAGRRIAILGHSQGGMVPRWALRFWPDTRPMVDDMIGLAPTNHGTTAAKASGNGVEAAQQQASDSQFIKALNSFKETFSGISYTVAYTHFDEVATPNADDNGTSALHTGEGRISNTAVQQICPLDTYEHLAVGTIDPAAYALAIDALTHDGPADASRVDRAVCGEGVMPGAKDMPLDGILQVLDVLPGQLSVAGAGGRKVNGEPPLKCYVTVECAGTQKAAGKASCTGRKRIKLRVGRRAKVTVAGKRVRVRRGYAHITLRGKPGKTVTVKIKRPGKKTRTRKFKICARK